MSGNFAQTTVSHKTLNVTRKIDRKRLLAVVVPLDAPIATHKDSLRDTDVL